MASFTKTQDDIFTSIDGVFIANVTWTGLSGATTVTVKRESSIIYSTSVGVNTAFSYHRIYTTLDDDTLWSIEVTDGVDTIIDTFEVDYSALLTVNFSGSSGISNRANEIYILTNDLPIASGYIETVVFADPLPISKADIEIDFTDATQITPNVTYQIQPSERYIYDGDSVDYRVVVVPIS